MLIVAWCGLTARSAIWIALPLSRPTVMASPANGWSRTICLPVLVVEIRRRMKLIVPPLPIEEDADDMRRQGLDQREGQRHMHIEPDLKQRAKQQMRAKPRKRRRPLGGPPDRLSGRRVGKACACMCRT